MRFHRLLKDEEGSALTEFAIMVPSIMIIFFYSVFFTDLAEVKLKTLEATRFASWEAPVYRTSGAIQQDLEQRFANFNSTDIEPAETTHMIGVTNLRIQTSYNDQEEVDMTGGAIPDETDGNGGGGASVGGVDRVINTVIGWAKLPTKGQVRSEITFQVDNLIIPDFAMFNTEVKASSEESQGLGSEEGFSITNHHVLVYDTWKAWPNKNRLVGSRNGAGANPAQTYSIAETAVVDQLKPIAFAKLASFDLMDKIGDVFDFFGLPNPLAYGAAPGPTTIRAPESTKGIASWSPTHNRNDVLRWGHRFSRSRILGDNPNPGIDHSRWTLPYSISTGSYRRKTITWWHNYAGAMISLRRAGREINPRNTTLRKWQTENDYYLSYNCRGHYYDGMITEAGEIGDYRNYDGCGDGADAVQGGAQSLLDRFGGGFQLPGF